MEYKNNKTANRRRYKSRYHSPHNYKTKRSKSENRAAILVGIATFVVIASLVLVFTFSDQVYNFFDQTFRPSTASSDKKGTSPATIPAETQVATAAATEKPTEKPTEAPTEKPTEAPTKPPVSQSDEFVRLMAAANLSEEQIAGTQMIFVESAGTSATVYTYEKDSSGIWQQKFEPMQGFVGTGGAVEISVPYDDATPKGTFNIEYAMGTNSDPGTPLKYYTINDEMLWITDPSSINYNRLLTETASYVDFEDYQKLDHYTRSYPYCVVFDYNRNPVDSARGCAKFLHVSYEPTYGGVGVSEDNMYNILMWLNPSESPAISIF